tara:strand:+ start:2420 stop:3724 length:1305 start_codon:yes stop_codon:yes gene_type:complete
MEVQEYLDAHKRGDDKSKGPTIFTRILWWCAGADSVFLNISPMKDRVKYAGIGGIVFCTGLLAAFSGGYAFYTIFSPKGEAVHDNSLHLDSIIPSIIFGIIWGLIILNLDRFIVSSTGKGDGTDKITFKEFSQAIPRIIIALILGIAISSPLEVRILQTEIDATLQKVQEDYKLVLDLQTDSSINIQVAREEEKIKQVELKLREYENNVTSRENKLNEQYRRLELEAEGRTGSGVAGRGPAWRDKKENLDRQKQELEKFKTEKSEEVNNWKSSRYRYNQLIDQLDKSRAEKKLKNEIVAHQLDGLLKRIEISHDIGGAVPWVILLVMLSIEMGPIFFKMMLTKGVYDYLVENNDRLFKANHGIIQKEEIFESKNGAYHKVYHVFLEEELELKQKKLKLEKQSQLNSKIIEEWNNKKSSEISKNPNDFFTDNDKS